MRFLLDQNVDDAVRRLLIKHRHECWTADQASLGTVDDDDLAVYAHDKRAALISHDREFSQRRRRGTVGQHIFLNCSELDAADIIQQRLPEIERLLDALPDLVITLTRTDLDVHIAWG